MKLSKSILLRLSLLTMAAILQASDPDAAASSSHSSQVADSSGKLISFSSDRFIIPNKAYPISTLIMLYDTLMPIPSDPASEISVQISIEEKQDALTGAAQIFKKCLHLTNPVKFNSRKDITAYDFSAFESDVNNTAKGQKSAGKMPILRDQRYLEQFREYEHPDGILSLIRKIYGSPFLQQPGAFFNEKNGFYPKIHHLSDIKTTKVNIEILEIDPTYQISSVNLEFEDSNMKIYDATRSTSEFQLKTVMIGRINKDEKRMGLKGEELLLRTKAL